MTYRMHNPGTSRHEQWYAANWNRWVSAGSYITKWEAKHATTYAAPVINPIPNPISPEQEAEHERLLSWVNERLTAIYTEPDGAMGYQYTAEHRTGVRVGEDWLKVAGISPQKPEFKALQVFTLYHSAMTDYGRKAA